MQCSHCTRAGANGRRTLDEPEGLHQVVHRTPTAAHVALHDAQEVLRGGWGVRAFGKSGGLSELPMS